MKRKNKIEQELDEKEFENELQRHLSLEYRKQDTFKTFIKDKNPWILGLINFFGTTLIILVFYWCLRFSIRTYSLGFLGDFFIIIDPLVYGISIALGVIAVIKKRSPLNSIIDWLP